MDPNNIILTQAKPQRHSYLYWLISDSFVMTKRSITHIVRSLDQAMSIVLFPVMFMLLNRYVFGGAIKTGNISYVNYLFAGILVQMLAFGANTTTLNLAMDMKEGIVDRFKSLPMAASALLIGHITADMFRNAMSSVVIILVGLLVGFRPNATAGEWALVFGLAMLFTLTISWLSAIGGLLVKSAEAAQWIGFVVIFPLTFVSSAFVPTSTMPTALRVFAENQPLSHVINAIRSWLVGTPMGNSAWLALIWCVCIIAVCMPLAAFLFRRHTPR